MLKYVVGNLLEAPEDCIAHGCNAQGVMGSGVAVQIKEQFPNAYYVYNRQHAEYDGLILGDVIWARQNNKFIANCITQERYGKNKHEQYVNYDAIRSCMWKININCFDIKTVVLPLIGAGLGGGDWSIIAKIIEEFLPRYTPTIYVLTDKDLIKYA